LARAAGGWHSSGIKAIEPTESAAIIDQRLDEIRTDKRRQKPIVETARRASTGNSKIASPQSG